MQVATERTAFSTRSTSQGSKSLGKMGVIRGLVRAPLAGDTEPEKAFGQTSERFSYRRELEEAQLPGPGQYQLYAPSLWRDNSASHSRKGFGALQSKVFRQKKFAQLLHTGPGPGQYHPAPTHAEAPGPGASPPQQQQHQAGRARGPAFPRAESGVRVRPTTSEQVGPGSYESAAWGGGSARGCGSGATVSFKSLSRRAAINEGSAGLSAPSSWRYEVARGLLADKPSSLKGSSAFCAPQPARAIKPHEYAKVLRSIAAAHGPAARALQLETASPGPGDYEVLEGFRRLADPRSASSKPRFAAAGPKGPAFPPANRNPGPGHYQLDSLFAGLKFRAYHSPFMSQTQRQAFAVAPQPGICAPYSPVLAASKKTFNINRNKKWI